MSAPSLPEQLALVAADPALAGHPVVSGLVTAVGERLGTLEAELTALREQVADLQRQLGRHSGNSGQPPSQDGPQAPPRTRSQRRSQGRRPGGQPGHAGRTRLQSERIDAHEDHWPTRCGGCGAALPRIAAGAPAVRQVHDLPEPPPLFVMEHRAQAVGCPGCGTRTRAAFPEGVDGPVRFGPRLEELAAYLRYVQHLPVARLRDLLRDAHGVKLSTGAVEALCRRAAARLADRAAQLGEQALALPVACMDETSLRVAGKRVWLHVICDGEHTFYRLGARGDVWTAYRGGTAVHDRLASYWKLPAGLRHAVCNAHLLRNLEEIVEREPTADSWAARMQRLLLGARGHRRALVRGDRRPGAGRCPRGDEGGLGCAPGAGPGALPGAASADRRRAPPRPQPGPGPVGAAGRLPAVHGRPGRALHQQFGGAGPAHGQAANEDLGGLPDIGRGRTLRPGAGPGRDRPPAGADPARPPAAGSRRPLARPRPALARRRRRTAGPRPSDRPDRGT